MVKTIHVPLAEDEHEKLDELKQNAGLTWRGVLLDWYKLKSEKLSDKDWKALKQAKKKLQGE